MNDDGIKKFVVLKFIQIIIELFEQISVCLCVCVALCIVIVIVIVIVVNVFILFE